MLKAVTGFVSKKVFDRDFIFAPLRLGVFALILSAAAQSQTLAPGGPGRDSQWPGAGKQGVGTSNTLESKIWFTLGNGMLTEVFYPQVDTANVNQLQFVVVDPKTKKVETELADAVHRVKPLRPDSLSFQQINTAKSNEWKITKTYTVDVERASILINITFETKKKLNLFVYYDPSLKNSGMHDSAWIQGGALLAQDDNIASALVANPSFNRNISNEVVAEGLSTNGFFGVNDGLTQLKNKPGDVNLDSYDKAENGNVVQVSTINPTKYRTYYRQSVITYAGEPIEPFTIALGFGKTPEEALKTAQISLQKGFKKCQAEYDKSWTDYVKTLPKVDAKYQNQFNMAAMVLKAFEDKTTRGGNVASLSTPWGGGNNGNETTTGYHLVWSRDLYQVATAAMALGDKAAAERALEFLFKYQQRADGSFPQISFLDGRQVGDSIQMDEVSFPLILAYQLGKTDKKTYEQNIKRSADYIAKNGPFSQQERWEEKAGFSPSTIAAEIAGLVCAAEIARLNNDTASAERWLEKADEWQANVEKWTATTTGKYGDGNYYLRLSQKGKPDSGEKIEIGNGGGIFDEREIVDAGFLELVRLGIKAPDDSLIQKSLRVVDAVIRVDTPNGEVWYRYNHDGYGDTYDGKRWNWDTTWRGNGHPWPLLAGERGQYELANYAWFKGRETPSSVRGRSNLKAELQNQRLWLGRAERRLDALLAFANDGLMIPEQVWDKPEIPKTIDLGFIPSSLKFGEGNGSATPLAWSMAQFVRLALNLKAGRNLETPDVVYRRYVEGKKN
ncbi:MAG: glucoamylase [Acidobacteria bacterium]|nr:glucoamylase [Acidobacteriota bacterium]